MKRPSNGVVLKVLKSPSTLSLSDYALSGLFFALTQGFLYRVLPDQHISAWVLYVSCLTVLDLLRYGFTTIPMIRFFSASNTRLQRIQYIGSAWTIGLVMSLMVAIMLWAARACFEIPPMYQSFFSWYPIYLFVSLPMVYCLTIFQANQRFFSILVYRQVAILPTLVYAFWILVTGREVTVSNVIEVQIYAHACTSLLVLLVRESGVEHLFKTTRQTVFNLLGFGKYNSISTVANQALKNSDILLIGMFMQAREVAIFSIPLKLMDMFEILLSGLTAPVYPKMSRQSSVDRVAEIYYFYVGIALATFLPFLAVTYFLASSFVWLLAGEGFVSDGMATHLFQIFLCYVAFFVVLRFSDILLDSINKPKLNFHKAAAMVIVNIIGDLFAIIYFESLVGVALVTLANILVGVGLSFHYLRREAAMSFGGFILYWRKVISGVAFRSA